MQNIFIDILPPWVETGLQPAFYDLESGTVLQQTARMYAKVRELTEAFNTFSTNVTNEINQFEQDTNDEIERFEQATNDEIERFEGVIDDTVEEYIGKFNDLHDYVEDYFDNLDVQEEINNKLDDMVEDGTLQEIITAYIQSNVAWTFDDVAEMQTATNLVVGSYAHTLGFHSIGDNGGAYYVIRAKEENETENGITTFEIGDTLIAEYVKYGNVSLNSLGVSSTVANNSPIINYAVSNFPEGTKFVLYPASANYVCTSAIDLNSKAFYFESVQSSEYDRVSDVTLQFTASDGFINTVNATFKDLCICGNTSTPDNSGIKGGGNISNCTVCYFRQGINGNYKQAFITECNLHNNTNAIINIVDSRVTNNTINNNRGNGVLLQAGANDNIITDNKIEWNTLYGVNAYNADHLVVTNNVIDRSGKSGIYIGGNLSANSVYTNNVLRRNGAESTGADSSNIQINGSYNSLVISNNVTQTGNSQDDGSGTTVPSYAIYIADTSSHEVYLLGNSLLGGTNANPIGKSNASKVTIIDQNHPIYDNLAVKTSSTITLNPNSTATFVVDFDSLPEQYDIGKSRKIVINYRTTSDYTYGSTVVNVYAYKQNGSYHLDLDETAIATGVTASGSYTAEDGFVITFTSTSQGTFNIKCTEYIS